MAITASLVGSETPQRVQIVVSATPSGEAWTLYGSAGGLEWVVPGGEGVGDGNQLTLTDNRGPLNVPITYRFVAVSTQTAAPVTVVQDTGDAVLGSLDGQQAVVVDLFDGAQDYELEVSSELFRVPGRARPVMRYDVTSDTVGKITPRHALTDTPAMRALLASGKPILCRLTAPALDLPLVWILGVTSISSTARLVPQDRIWEIGYVALDDPYMDERLGAFSWAYVDDVLAGMTWDGFDTLMSGRSWDELDSLDWSAV